jgi:hypothetical protein
MICVAPRVSPGTGVWCYLGPVEGRAFWDTVRRENAGPRIADSVRALTQALVAGGPINGARLLARLGELLGHTPETVRQASSRRTWLYDGHGALTVTRLTAITAFDYSDGAGKTSSSTV